MLYTYESGKPDGKAILFLHGGGLSHKSWLPVIERLPQYRCLAPDLPEQGRSKKTPYSIAGAAEAAAEVVRKRAPKGVAHVVALSLGAPVAFTMLRNTPELVQSALLSGGSGQISRFMSWLGRQSLWSYKFFPPEKLVDATIKQQGIPAQYEDLVREDLRASLDLAFMRRYMTDLARWQLPEQINVPLLIVVGQREASAAMGFARSYLGKFPDAKGVVVPDAGHVWSLQQPDLFAALVTAWVEGQPLPKGLLRLKAAQAKG